MPIAEQPVRPHSKLAASPMLFTPFLAQLLPLIMGRRDGGLFTHATGLSPRAGERLARQRDGMTALRRIGRERIREKLQSHGGYSWDEAAAILARAPGLADPDGPPTPLAALVALSPGAPLGGYERTLAFSIALDGLSARLEDARDHDSLGDARDAVEEAGFASPDWFRDLNEAPDVGEDASQWRPWLQAGNWAAMDLPLRTLGARALFQWFATWDVDFCIEYFQPLKPRPLFPWVAPMFDPRVFKASGAKIADGEWPEVWDVPPPTMPGAG